MTRYEQLLRALAAGDLESAKAFWLPTTNHNLPVRCCHEA